jgi:enoyl-CoA hydratase/carnithine racemase
VAIKSNELETIAAGQALIIRFTRPEIRSPLSVTVLDQLKAILDETADKSCSQIVFTGTGNSFASGADLREIADLAGERVKEFARKGQSLMQQVAAMPQQTFAAINGYCFGGALDLALSCDFRIASPAAKFAHPGTGLGIITGWGGTQRLPRLVGQANALEMFFTATAVEAERAFDFGLVDLVADDIFRNELLEIDVGIL